MKDASGQLFNFNEKVIFYGYKVLMLYMSICYEIDIYYKKKLCYTLNLDEV